LHPRPVVKLALAGENRLPLRGAEQPKRKPPLGRRSGDEAVTRRQAVNASSGEHAGEGQEDEPPRALAEMLLIPGGLRARFPR